MIERARVRMRDDDEAEREYLSSDHERGNELRNQMNSSLIRSDVKKKVNSMAWMNGWMNR